MRFFYLLFALLLVGCGQKHEAEVFLEKELGSRKNYGVIYLPVGDDVKIPITPLAAHVSNPDPFGGAGLDHRVFLKNETFMRELLGCQGCDSCMQSYADAGLVEYTIKEKRNDHVLADVQLTSKGESYLIENLKEDVTTETSYVQEALSEGGKLLVVSYETDPTCKFVKSLCDSHHVFKVLHNYEITPFFKAVCKKPAQETSEPKYIDVIKNEHAEDGYFTDAGIMGRVKNDGYDLSKYGSMEEILQAHFALSDSIVYCDSHYIEFSKKYFYHDKITDTYITQEKAPDWYTKSVVEYHPKAGNTNEHCIVAKYSCKLDGVEDTYNWHWSETEEIANEAWKGEDWQREDWNVKELIYKVKVQYSPFGKHCAQSKTDSEIYYGRCPYLEIENYIYFLDGIIGLWSKSKADLRSCSYKDHFDKEGVVLPLPYISEHRLKLKKKFEEIEF